MKCKFLFLSLSFALFTASANAQGVAVNTTGTAADNSAMLDVNSTSQGMLVPRMLSSQRTGIASPATGLLVYQTDAPAGFYYYNGSSWTSLSTPSSLPPSGSAGGDLTGSSYPNPVVANGAISGSKIASNTITDGNISSTAAIAYSKISGGPSSLPPNGSAGGDLAGSSYPNPVVANGAISGSKIAGNTITDGNISTTAAIAYSKISGGPSSLPPNGSAGGDLTGSYPSPTLNTSSASTGNNIITTVNNASSGTINASKLNLSAIPAANLTGSGTLPSGVLPSTVTTQSNVFNGNNELVKTNASGQIPVATVGTGSGAATTYLNGAGAFTTPAGGGSSGQYFYTSASNPTGASNATYSTPLTGSTNFTSTSGPITSGGTLIETAGTINALYFYGVNIAGTASNTMTLTLYKNGVATAITASITIGATVGNTASASDLSHTVTVAAGDLIVLSINQSITTTGFRVSTTTHLQ